MIALNEHSFTELKATH